MVSAPKTPSIKDAVAALCEAAGLDPAEVTSFRFYAEHGWVELNTPSGVHRVSLDAEA